MSPKSNVYLDNNASTAIDPSVLNVVIADLTDSIGNPSSIHAYGQKTRQKLNKARKTIATALKAKPSEIIFTSGGTEGANYILKGFLAERPNCHVITSNVEHGCLYMTLKALEKEGIEVTFLPPTEKGNIDPKALIAALKPNTGLIALTAVNNETGVKNDVAAIAAIANEAKAFLLVDGVALLGKENFIIPDGVSAMIFSGHKIHAPKGVGFVLLRSKASIQPLMMGGEQELSRRAGSENVSGIVGMAEAVRLLDEVLPEAEMKMRFLRDDFESKIMATLPNVKVNGGIDRICNTSNLCFEGIEGETLLTALDLAGIAVSHGSACSSGALEPSRVLLNMGLSYRDAAASLRFSLSRYTTQEEIDYTVATLVRLVERMRSL